MQQPLDLPNTSRFYNLHSSKDPKSYAYSYGNSQVLVNGLTAQYAPFFYPQERPKQSQRLNVPLDLRHLLSRIQYIRTKGNDGNSNGQSNGIHLLDFSALNLVPASPSDLKDATQESPGTSSTSTPSGFTSSPMAPKPNSTSSTQNTSNCEGPETSDPSEMSATLPSETLETSNSKSAQSEIQTTKDTCEIANQDITTDYGTSTSSAPDSVSVSSPSLHVKGAHSSTDTKSDNKDHKPQYTNSSDSIPTFKLTHEQYSNPILFIESVSEIGRQYGAIKLVPPGTFDEIHHAKHMQINPDLFWFQTNRLLNNLDDDELKKRFEFHRDLMTFHLAKASSNGTSDDQEESSLTKLPMIDKRPLDLYKLFRSVMFRGGFLEVVSKKLWAQIGRELGYRGKIMTSLSSTLKSTYMKILFPYEQYIRNSENVKVKSKESEAKGNCVPVDGKKRKAEELSPLILGSPRSFKRSVRLKARKGFLLNTFERVELKQLNTIVSKPSNEPTPEIKVKQEEGNEAILKEGLTGNSTAPSICDKPDKMKVETESPPSSSRSTPTPKNLNNSQASAVSSSGKKKGRIPTSKSSAITVPITPNSQLNSWLKSLSESSSQDSTLSTSNIRISSVYSLRQFVEKDLKFQEYLVRNHPMFSNNKDYFYQINSDQFDQLFWEIVYHYMNRNHDLNLGGWNNSLELENAVALSTYISGSSFPRLGDDLQNIKFLLANSNLLVDGETNNVNGNNGSNTNAATNMDSMLSFSEESNSNKPAKSSSLSIVEESLAPWNLHNLPILPNSLFGVLGENDVNNQDLYTPTVNVGMTFSIENWRTEDHFSYLCDSLIFGAPKKWYFVPELQFDRFEELTKLITQKETRMHINNNKWDTKNLVESIPDQWEIDHEAVESQIENMVPPFSDYNNNRLNHSNDKFQLLISHQKSKRQVGNDVERKVVLSYNQDCFINPEQLKAHGIKFLETVQQPGEIIIKFPKVYSSAVSWGLNLSEEVNFATQHWLNYALEAEKWLNKQLLLPNFLTFKLLTNLAQLLESPQGGQLPQEIMFNSKVFEKASDIFESLVSKEIDLRIQVRKLNLKEITIDETVELDTISDDDLMNTYPSRVVLHDTEKSQKFILSLSNYLSYVELNHPTIKDATIKPELQLFCSDDKLRHYEKLLKGFSVDFNEWMTKYEELMATSDLLPLKTFKQLFWEAGKIKLATNSMASLHSENIRLDSPEYKKFEEYVRNLEDFINYATSFVDECHVVLSVKHQQRIRGGGSRKRDKSENDATEIQNETPTKEYNILERLIKLLDVIPTINFACPEADQIIELQTEIENFERATRNFLESGKTSLQEFNDLISLGESFGVELPSLKFLKRVKSRILWLKDFNIIKSGGDPSDNKDFTLRDLEKFGIEGEDILGSEDIEVYRELQEFITSSIAFDLDVKQFLNYELIDELSLLKLDFITKRLQTLVLFLYQETFDKLLLLSENYDLISKLQKFKVSIVLGTVGKFKVNEIIQLRTSINESRLLFKNDFLKEPLENVNFWVESTSKLFRDDSFRSIYQRNIPLNRTLLKKLENSYAKLGYSFAENEHDSYLCSSSYLAIKELDLPEEKVPIYCNCREPEFGTMIGCDICSEWYHVHCIQESGKSAQEYASVDKYACPLCILLQSTINIDQTLNKKPSVNKLKKALKEGNNLVLKAAEMDDLQEFVDLCEAKSELYTLKLQDIILGQETDEIKADQIRFYLRKVYGSSVFLDEFFVAGSVAFKELSVKIQNVKEVALSAEKEAVNKMQESEDFRATIRQLSVHNAADEEQSVVPMDVDKPEIEIEHKETVNRDLSNNTETTMKILPISDIPDVPSHHEPMVVPVATPMEVDSNVNGRDNHSKIEEKAKEDKEELIVEKVGRSMI